MCLLVLSVGVFGWFMIVSVDGTLCFWWVVVGLAVWVGFLWLLFLIMIGIVDGFNVFAMLWWMLSAWVRVFISII